MARKSSDGNKGKGIEAKNGKLYIVTNLTIVGKNKNRYKAIWEATGLDNNPNNVKLAKKMRDEKLLKPNSITEEEFTLNQKKYQETDATITITEFTNKFLEDLKRGIEENTYGSYYYRAKAFTDYFKDTPLTDLNQSNIAAFFDDFISGGKHHERYADDVKSFFSRVLTKAVQEGLISFNPVPYVSFDKAMISKYAVPKVEGSDFFDYEEAQKFLKYSKGSTFYPLFLLVLIFGLRREEVLGLKWSAVNFNTWELSINHTVTKGFTGVNSNNTTKTPDSARAYPFMAEIAEALKDLKEKEKLCKKAFGSKYDDNDYIFKNYKNFGKPFHPDSPTKAFSKIIKAHPDLPQAVTLHKLRSSCVSILVHEGWDVKSVQSWVGQKDIHTTMDIYAKVKGRKVKKEILGSIITMLFPDDKKDKTIINNN